MLIKLAIKQNNVICDIVGGSCVRGFSEYHGGGGTSYTFINSLRIMNTQSSLSCSGICML